MSDDVAQLLGNLSLIDDARTSASPRITAPQHAVAGLELAVASLRELIGGAYSCTSLLDKALPEK